MKAHLICTVFFIAIMSGSVFGQSANQTEKKLIPTHPLERYSVIFENSVDHNRNLKQIYDSYQLTEVVQQIRVEDNWLSQNKSENTYQSGNRTETRIYNMTENGGEWNLYLKQTYSYSNGLLTTNLYQEINSNITTYQDRTLITYVTGGGITLPRSLTYQFWDATEEDWINEDRTLIESENGTILGGSDDIWVNGEWEQLSLFTFEDLNGDLVETRSDYDSESEEWINSELYVYTGIGQDDLLDEFRRSTDYIDNGSILSASILLPDFVYSEWMGDMETGMWVEMERQVSSASTVLEFGATSAILISAEQKNEESEDWTSTFQVLAGYDDDMRAVGLSAFNLDNSEQFEKVLSEEYQYNTSGLLEFILQYGAANIDGAFKSSNEIPLVGRAVLSWNEISTSTGSEETPLRFSLEAAYPNPFNPSTVIPFQLAAASEVRIQVFDMLGRRVGTLVDEFKPAGNHTVRFEGSGLSSGIYMVRFTASGVQQTRSVSLIK